MRLENGLQLLIAPSRAAPVVAVQAWVGVGSADESRQQAGIAHVLEHMLFKGTARYGVGEIARTVETAGGEINAWTSFDQTVFHVVLASRHFDTAVDVLAEALLRPTLDPEELGREREVILEELRQTNDDPMRTVAQTLFQTAYSVHPYRHPVIGTAESVSRLTRDDLIEFMRRWYVASNLTVAIAGDVDPEQAEATVRAAFESMPDRVVDRRRRREPAQAAPRVALETRDVHDAHVAIGFHVPELTHGRAVALDVGAICLGQGESSRLSARLRRGRELVIAAFAYAHTLRDRGLFVVSAAVPPERVREAVRELAAELARLAAEPPTPRELDKARRAIKADAIYQRQTAEGMARKLGYYETMAGDVDFESEILRRIHRLSSADVSAAAAAYLRADNASLAVLMPHDGELAEQAGRDAEARRLERELRAGFAGVGPARAPAPRAAGELIREVLPNGARVVIKRDPSVPVVAFRTAWTGGARLETVRSAGISNLLAASITAGCGSLTAEQVIDRVDDLAGTLVGIAGRNSFGVRSEWLASDWERGFDLMTSCLLEPRFEADHVDRERRRLLDDLSSRRDSAGFVVFRNFAETLFRSHPYRLPPGGTERSLVAMTRRRIADHYRRYYPLSELTLAAVGDIDPDRLLVQAEELLGCASPAPTRRRQVRPERFAGRSAELRRVVEHMAREQAHLVVGFPGLTIADPDRPVLELLMTVLAGQGGRLFLELRDRRALAYRVSAFSVEGIDPGYVAAYIACAPEKLPAAVAGIREELDRIAAGELADAEIERAARFLIGGHEIALQRRASLAASLALDEAYGVGHDHHLRYPSQIGRVTAGDVARVAAELFDWDLAVTSIVAPESHG